MFALIQDGIVRQYPYTVYNLKNDYPNTSFPNDLTDAELAEYSVFRVYTSEIPIAEFNQVVEESTPVFNQELNRWEQSWGLRNLTDEEYTEKLNLFKNSIILQVQDRLDNFAKTRNYDGILSLCTYATDTNPKFQQEGQYGVNIRSQTWAKLYEILAEVEQGTRPLPQGYGDIEPLLPQLQWPEA